MLDFDKAQSQLAAAGQPLSQQHECPLSSAAGRILATRLTATLDMPPANNSAMDGYAVRHADCQNGAALPVQQRCYAGQVPQPLQPGQAIRLFTGSVLPAGADTVVMQEDCTEADDMLTVRSLPAKGSHVRRQGEDVARGSELLPAGTLLGPAHVALLASQGLDRVPVYAPLRIGILTTGDELAAPGSALGPAQIYNSNGPMLAALTEGLGAQAVHVLHAMDTHESLAQAFATLIDDCDLILTVGGVSVGEKDLVKPAIEHAGGTLELWRVNMKPGKPVALAHAAGKPIVCLPGNPVSAFVVFALLVSPLIRRMQGRAQWMPLVQYGQLSTASHFHETREEFIRVQAEHGSDGATRLLPHARQGSGVISSLPWSGGVARLKANTRVGDGDVVPYYSWAHWLS